MPANWIADNSHAEAPPAYFLQRVSDFDSMLVILPSRKVPGAYVIARRRQWSKGLSTAALLATIDQPDTKMCLLNDVVPVTLMYHTGPSWDPEPLIASLDARDMWKHGGPDKVADMLDAQDETAKKKIQAETRDDIYNRSGDAWRSYQARTGASSIKFHDNYKSRQERRTEQTAPSSSTAGLGES